MILYCQASLPSIALLLDQNRNFATLQLLCSPPHVNPAATGLQATVPTWESWHIKSPRHRPGGLTCNYCPCVWSSAPSAGRRHLPLDGLSFSLKDILPECLPLAFPHLTLACPYDCQGSVPYGDLKQSIHRILSTQLATSSSNLPQYAFTPSLTPHAFMGLPKFMAGWVHQMRAGKSYLATYRNWSDRDELTLCPSCEEEDEFFKHTMLYCPAKAQAQESLLLGSSSLGPQAPVWSSVPLLIELFKYISKTATPFPPSMPLLGSSNVLSSPSSSSDGLSAGSLQIAQPT